MVWQCGRPARESERRQHTRGAGGCGEAGQLRGSKRDVPVTRSMSTLVGMVSELSPCLEAMTKAAPPTSGSTSSGTCLAWLAVRSCREQQGERLQGLGRAYNSLAMLPCFRSWPQVA